MAIQPGHWKVEELPDELRRLRNSTGAEYGGLREVEVNLRIASILAERVKAEGWTSLLVPATVPPGLQADAFLSIHADYGNGEEREGYKLSPPFRASPASRRLAESLEDSFLIEKGLSPDPWHGLGSPPKSPTPPTVNMRGYFGFNYRRFEHTMSPYTPAVLLELGYLTNPTDRARLTRSPEGYADILLRGLRQYFKDHHRRTEEFLTPLSLPWVSVAPNLIEGALIRISPEPNSSILWSLEPGTILLPVDEKGEWYEVFVRARFATGWIRKSDTRLASDPRWPMPGEAPNNGSATAQ
ncbi:MAG: N-acetylmuramoyl-L-alanine amidase [Spirochaetes bacterium]|nr:N-acetylmuramoyl-L-alanine amidase [Spirochaetota bacterium]